MENKKETASKVKIVVLHRGWVVVGKVDDDGSELVITGASVIRRWGTTKGLGEIAEGGPTSSTVLDKCPPIRIMKETAIYTMDCNDAKWAKHVAVQS